MSRLLTQIYLFEELFAALRAAFPDEAWPVEAKPLDDTFLTLPPDKLRPVVQLLMDQFDIYHLSTITGDDAGEEVRLLYHFWSGYGLTLCVRLPYTALSIPTLTDLIPGARFYEQEVQETLGVTFEGLGVDGPLFLLLKEPFTLPLEGEHSIERAMHIGRAHCGIEQSYYEHTYVQNVHWIERSGGIHAFTYAAAFCQGVEGLLKLEVPLRGVYLRALLCELERIYSHLLWLGGQARSVESDTIFTIAWRGREIVLDMMKNLSDGRASHAVNVIGGVRIDLTPERRNETIAQLDALEAQIETLLGVVENEQSFQARLRNIGHLSMEQARRYCVVGPVARASGLDMDLRRDASYPPYDRLQFRVPVRYEGDVWARTRVRMLEMVESVHLCRQILTDLPDGPTLVRAKRLVPPGEVVSRAEAPCGEVFYCIRSDGSDRPVRVKVRMPTLTNFIV